METKKDWRKLEYVMPIQESVSVNGEFLIRGTAINATVTRNGVEYGAEDLEKSAFSLRNKPILKDHTNEIDSIVGKTTENVMWNVNEKKVDFEGKIVDEKIKSMINDGLIGAVSVGAMVSELAEVQNDEGVVTHVQAKGIDFVELSLVAVPADPNAGFSKAIAESFSLKNKKVDSLNDGLKKQKQEDSKMEKKSDKAVKKPVKEVSEKPKEKAVEEQIVKVDSSQLDEAIKKAKELLDLQKQISEKPEEEAEEKEEVKEEEKEEVAEEKEEVKDETQGEVAAEEEVVAEESSSDYIIEKADKGFAIYKERVM